MVVDEWQKSPREHCSATRSKACRLGSLVLSLAHTTCFFLPWQSPHRVLCVEAFKSTSSVQPCRAPLTSDLDALYVCTNLDRGHHVRLDMYH